MVEPNISKIKRLFLWLKAKQFIIFGSLNVVFNIVVLIGGITHQPSPYNPEAGSISVVLILFCAPISLLLYYFGLLGLKINPKQAIILLIIHGIFLIISWIFYFIFLKTYLRELGVYFLLHFLIGGLTATFYKLSKK